jgi:hypothetical protein
MPSNCRYCYETRRRIELSSVLHPKKFGNFPSKQIEWCGGQTAVMASPLSSTAAKFAFFDCIFPPAHQE